MYVCICEAVTEREIIHAVKEKGVKCVRTLGGATGACRQCGKCAADAKSLILGCMTERQHSDSQQAA